MNRISAHSSVLCLSIAIFFVTLMNVNAQSLDAATRLLGIEGDISSVRIDDLSDVQIEELFRKGHEKGYTDNEIFSFLEVSEMSPLEVSKLRLRYNEIKNGSNGFIDPNNEQSDILEQTLNPNDSDDPDESVDSEDSDESVEIDEFNDQTNELNDSSTYIYGKSMFKDGSIGFFDKTVDKTAPENYILGVGDIITLNIWGDSDFSGNYIIQKWGGISDSKIDRVYLRGLTFEKAKSLLIDRFGARYDKLNSSYEVTLSYSREISVSIVGEVERPGTYKIPAINSLFNSLTICGGPSEMGTLRNIVVLRDGKNIHTLDVYKYLSSPEEQDDFYLENGDIIYVSVLNNVVEAIGEFKRPGRYELLYNEGISALLDFSGGYTSEAYLKNVQITRFEENQNLVFNDVNLDSIQRNSLNVLLFDGDVIKIDPISGKIIHYVDILGSVNIPSRYDFVEGESVFDLIERANGLSEDAYVDLAYIVRSTGLKKDYIKISLNDSSLLNKDQYKLVNKDIVKVFSLNEFGDTFTIEVFGLVRDPKPLIYSSTMTLYDAIVLSGGLEFDADSRIEISRFNALSGKNKSFSKYVDIGVKDGNIINDEASQLLLKPFDRLFVRRKSDILENEIITLSGEVLYPGEYALNSREDKISDIIERAGGLTSVAQKDAAIFYRESGGIGEVVLELDKALDNNASTFNYILKGGDVITIPKLEYFVSLKGAIDYPIDSSSSISAPWVPRKSARYYINKYGNGFAEDASKKRTYVLQANRKVSRTSRVLFVKKYPRVEPGGVVFAGVKDAKNIVDTPKEKVPISWNQVIRDVLTAATAVVPLVIVLVNN